MSSEEELQKLAYEAQYLQSNLQEMQRQYQQAVAMMNQIEQTEKTVAALKDAKEDTYFQLGAGAFMKGKPNERKGVLIDMGANVFMEKTAEEARELLKARKANIEKAVGSIKKNLEEVSRRLEEIDSLAADLQK
ncbi:MAG: prefoldin subunit alpha [Candidatus Micrarchaeota archaeon]